MGDPAQAEAIVPLGRADGRCGGKAANLGRLIQAGFSVPDGVVIPDPPGEEWLAALEQALSGLGTATFAVRSSAVDEDGAEASFAGQLHTTLGAASVAEVAAAVRRTGGSASSAAALAYVTHSARSAVGVVPAIVQVMVSPQAAGVLFTRHPVTGADQVVVEAVAGRGDALVDGSVTPERWIVDGDTVTPPDRETRPPAQPSGHAVLTPQQARSLADLGRRVEELFGEPQDVEWALTAGRCWVLQARPITTLGTFAAAPGVAPGTAPGLGEVLVTGTPASPGTASGRATVVLGLDDFAQFATGDVLVCRATSPAWTPLLARAAAVVTETGGMLAHAAIVAREFGIPAVLAAEGATTVLARPGAVFVDGSRGLVIAHRASEPSTSEHHP